MPENSKESVFVIISDNQANYLLERVLRSAGYAVTSARDKLTSEKLIETSQPSIVIIGEKLTDGNGLELARNLIRRFPALPVLLFVNSDSPDLLKEALRSGVTDYLCLPLHTEDILQAVQRSIRQAKFRKDWVILESKRATASLQHRMDEIETLAQLGRSITASLNLDYVLASVVDAAVDLTGAEEGSLLLLDDISGELYMRASRNFQEEFVRTFRLPIHDTLAGSVIRTGQAVLLDEQTPQKIKTSYLVHSLIYVPLQSRGQIVGVLGVDNRHNRTAFTDHHVKLVSTVADYAVIAIENAHLYTTATSDRNKLETILTNIQDGVMVLDPDQRFMLVNQTARAAFNLGDGSFIGKQFTDVIQKTELLELLKSPGSEHYPNQCEIELDDGRVFSAQFTPIQDVGIAITFHDITYHKKLDRLKSDFVSTISHDLRSPLTAILGYIELLDRAGPINELQRDFINRVQTSVHSITSLVNDLLNLGRIESGFDTRKETISLSDILNSSLTSVDERLKKGSLTLSKNYKEDLPPLYGNPIQIRQMVDNLLDNAITYTPEGGKIKVEAQVDGKQLILLVSDTGNGIPALDMPYIFDKFYRASNTSSDLPGSGLGLSIVKSIIETHQGRIWVDSTIDKGTNVTVVLPIAEGAAT
jgi:two-component system, OmpR family, phosphate regulon sensor histidine kinase PhoR